MTAKPIRPPETAAEFDVWADNGRGESMARGHLHATKAAIEPWALGLQHTVLDVGCGQGWAVRLMLGRGAGTGIGVDLSPAMVTRATTKSEGLPATFHVASADALPLEDASISHILNVESLYYYPDPAAAIQEWARVAKPGAQLAIMVDLYAENPASHTWIEALEIGVHLLSTQGIIDMLAQAGWTEIETEQVVDPSPLQPEAGFEPSKFWPTYSMYLAHRATGSLVVRAQR